MVSPRSVVIPPVFYICPPLKISNVCTAEMKSSEAPGVSELSIDEVNSPGVPVFSICA